MIEKLSSSWQRFGYGDDTRVLRTLAVAVDDLIEQDSEKQSTVTWMAQEQDSGLVTLRLPAS